MHEHSAVWFIIFLCMSMCLESAKTPPIHSINEPDYMALLDFKSRITEDPLNIMSSWNDSTEICSWIGVTCHNNNLNKRVQILKLTSQKLVGSLPPSIGNLTYLTDIDLIDNNFHGEIPQEIGRLLRLQHLNLSMNSFGGKIPGNLSHCTQLKVLSLVSNKLIGSIPDQLRSLLSLTRIWIDGNNLSGTIPVWIGNFSSLYSLSLSKNKFQGSIPNELGVLTGLGSFRLGENNLSGIVPSSFYNISSMYIFGVTQNQLHGELPQNVGVTLPNLQVFVGGANKFTGSIPSSLSNASKLNLVDFGQNGFTGKFPGESFGKLQSLAKLNFDENRLGTGRNGDMNFMRFLANCTSMEVLGVSRNRFGGELPESIANLSTQLRILTLGLNLLHGSIPSGIGNLVNLIALGLEGNYFGGNVPNEIGKLQKFQVLYLNHNRFSGSIPSSLGNLTSLTRLHIQENKFEGNIPQSLGNCTKLLILNISSNNLSGSIPKQLLMLTSLSISLSMSNNSLTGSLPSEVGDLQNLSELDVSENKLSGEIPAALGSCTSLERLHLEGNEFEGTIPQSLEDLRGLEVIDVSRNNLSGQIPEFLSKFSFLKQLNLSHNDFEGELPKQGIFTNASGISILGNDRLCGGIPKLSLPSCSSKKPRSARGLLALKVVIPITCALAFAIALSCCIAIFSKVKKLRGRAGQPPRSPQDWKSGVSYSQLLESTDGFSKDNLIGSGSFGSVYKGVKPSDGRVVAVKVLNLQQQGASKSFIDECKALRSIRHRNLLKIVTVCSSIDNQGNDFKSIVFEFMENGSMDAWLHRKDDEEQSQMKRSLSMLERLNISIDIASALHYLHHDCETPIVHCDLKPSNVLLDKDMVAHVGDFGLASFLFELEPHSSTNQNMSIGLKGSIGYIPPEYGMGGQVSIQGDIYSYGILLLEIFTGKRPTDDSFKDGLSLHQFTAKALPDHVMDVVEPSLLKRNGRGRANDDDDEDDDEIQERPIVGYYHEDGDGRSRRLEECLVSIVQIGVACSTILPTERMLMNVVVNKLKAIRDSYMKFINPKRPRIRN